MKRFAYPILAIIVICSCNPKQSGVERFVEDGVEVVVNHLEPHKIKGEPSTFTLEEEFRIDTESEDLSDLGIRGIDEMDVDSGGNIYLSTGEQVLKFNNTGGFIQAIGRTGQEPGEYRMATSLRITDSGQLSFFDAENSKFLFFNPDGNFEKITDLYPSYWIEIPYFQTDKISLLGYNMSYAISDGKIYVSSNVKDDLEIAVYNFQGDLIKKIRKKTELCAVPKEYKERIIERWKSSPAWEELNFKEKHYFPDYFPPFKELWVDEEGRVFVETYEEDEGPDEVLLQILNPDGIFVGTKYLKVARSRKFKNNHLYCVSRKKSGFEELIAYKMIWQE